jgi:Family of unknown function (DUF5701)
MSWEHSGHSGTSTVSMGNIDGASAHVTELDRQLATVIDKGYPALAGRTVDEFAGYVEPLRAQLDHLVDGGVPGLLRFVLVIADVLVAAREAALRMELPGGSGVTDMTADDLARFHPIDTLTVPAGPAYLLVDVDTGKDLLDVTPDDALAAIAGRGRSPLTVSEGIAVVTQFPSILRGRNCFSLLGSRCGDRRVTALWVSRKRPRLGWCWAGNPHAWLGSASCAGRLAAPAERASGQRVRSTR